MSSPTKLSEEQMQAIATAIDAIAAIAAYSSQEGSLQLMVDGLEFEFGEMQAGRIVRLAPKFSEVLNGEGRSEPVATTPNIATMSLRQSARRKPSGQEVAAGVRMLTASQHQRALMANR